jgi:hypothetical protein
VVLKGAASEQRQRRNSQLDYISAAQQATQVQRMLRTEGATVAAQSSVNGRYPPKVQRFLPSFLGCECLCRCATVRSLFFSTETLIHEVPLSPPHVSHKSRYHNVLFEKNEPNSFLLSSSKRVFSNYDQ